MIQELQTGLLDINNKYNVDFSCKQLDDIILKIIVYDKSLPADLSNYNVRLKAFKADQVPLIQNTNITIKDNVVTIKADKQLTTTNGIVKAELQFINKTTLEKKSTFYINIEVVASVLDVEGTVSTPTCTILEEIDHKLDEIENIGQVLDEAKDVRDTLTNKTIPAATNINSKLESNINSANTKITEVENIISSATSKIEEVETSINNADSSKKELDLSKTNGDISKENLDAANVQAEKNIEELNSLGNVTDLAKNVQTNTTDIGTLKENVQTNTSQLKEIEKNKVDKTALNDCVILKRTGVLLNGNANLNSSILYAIGTYYYPDNGHTIYNSPTTDRFKMTVEEIGIPQVLLQKIITGNTGAGVKIYTRYANLSTNTFSEWQQLATVDDTGWIDLPLLNGATTTSDKAIYRRIGKMVYFKGVVNNITTDNFIFGNLPIGFRPNSKSGGPNIPVPLFLQGEDIPSRLTVYQNGNLQLSRKNDKNTCYLDGVIFVLD
ncbi:viral A-type inclusion protein [Clostridium botulinum]|uniref:viral A-type inclusion protein n=1 Tax=Clostridium botulinum TaxID=1491 RepID=UPI000ADF144F|nr:viral A-type inclusion protein [Clostridium botulinum]